MLDRDALIIRNKLRVTFAKAGFKIDILQTPTSKRIKIMNFEAL